MFYGFNRNHIQNPIYDGRPGGLGIIPLTNTFWYVWFVLLYGKAPWYYNTV